MQPRMDTSTDSIQAVRYEPPLQPISAGRHFHLARLRESRGQSSEPCVVLPTTEGVEGGEVVGWRARCACTRGGGAGD